MRCIQIPLPSQHQEPAFFSNYKTIGIHYVIGRNGEMLAGIQENQLVNHAFGGNKSSIGIELVNDGDEGKQFHPQQISALVMLLCRLRSTHKISGIKSNELDNRMFRRGASSFKEKADPNSAIF